MADQLLGAVGMVTLVRVEKSRCSYRHPDRDEVIVSIDTITGAGIFVETEVMSTDATAASAVLAQVEQQLAIDDKPVENLPYRDLVMASSRP